MVASEYFFANSALGANIRAPVNSNPVLDNKRLRMPPVLDLCREYGVMIAYASCSAIGSVGRRRFGGVGGRRGRRGCRRSFTAQNLIHYGATGRTFAFNSFSPVLRG